MRSKVNFHLILLALIVILAFFLRIYRLDEIPAGFFADEASIGYNAYTVLTKGTDEYGTPYPFFFKAFGEYKSPVQIYATVPFIAMFGLNEFSVRLTSVVFGTITVVALYFLVKTLFEHHKNNKEISLFSAFFLAISPWHIHFSRTAFEQMPFIFFTVLGLYFFLKALQNSKLLLASIILFSLALYSYFPARLFVPLFGTVLFFLYINFFLENKKIAIFSFILLLVSLVPFLHHTFSEVGFSRYNQVSIFVNPPSDTTVIKHIAYNYLSHFSLDFLFLKGDIDMPGQFITRHSIRGMGQLYFFQLPFIIFGFIYLLKNKRGNMLTTLILTIWLLLYPIGSMFTIDKSAQATRSIIGVIPFQVLSAVGVYYVVNLFRSFKTSKRNQLLFSLSSGFFVGFILGFFTYFLYLYFVRYPLYSSGYFGWQYGYKQTLQYFKTNENYYDTLLITHRYNNAAELLKFYNVSNNCKKCIVMTNPISINSVSSQLFALRDDDIEETKTLYKNLAFENKEIIYVPSGDPEIFIGSFIKK